MTDLSNILKFSEDDIAKLNSTEKLIAVKILKEYAEEGKSKTLMDLYYSDYDEIPVSIVEFLHNPEYLGKGLIDSEGRYTVFKYWENMLIDMFPDPMKPAKYNTLALSGAIGLGKSFVAVLCGLYELYRMMCLKDPYAYYGLQPIDTITFALMNITMDAASGVGWSKIQELLQASPWFMTRGTVSGTSNVVWKPPKGIELIYGSQSRHIIGRAVYWCLDGDTEIATNLGDIKLKDVINKEIQVYNINECGNICLSEPCVVLPTAVETTEYQIEMEDGTVIKCTPTHRFMLFDGSYKQAQDLTEDDGILEFIPYGDGFRENGNIQRMKLKSIKKVSLAQHKQYYDVINANPYNNFLIKTESGYIGSHNCFFDEINKLVSVLSNKFAKIPVELLEHCFNFINYNAKMKYA